jgi:biopolymer transport protein TolR
VAYNPAHRRKPMSEINVVPYIDVMLVLLIIFMITAPLLEQGVDVKLPNAPSKPLQTDSKLSEPLYVNVDRAGRIYLTINETTTQIAPRSLADAVRAIITKDPRRPVYVKGDGQVSYQRVIAAMVELQKAGVEDVGLLTEPPPAASVSPDKSS